jgi:predicted Zn-dependent protease
VLYGLGAQVGVILPYSRKHEYEADRLGLIFMAMAGYDPNEAVAFWERMSANGSGSTLEFMSTHPTDQNRIANMKKVLPEAMGYYKK